MDISVVIPAYNAGQTIGRALESVCNQTVPPREIIVVDDGSTDDTASIVAEHARKDSRIIYILQVNGGPSLARNKGIACSQHEWIAFLDSDDWWEPNKLEKQMSALQENSADLVYTGIMVHTKNGGSKIRPVNPRAGWLDSLRFGNGITPSTVLIRRKALSATGLFDPNLKGVEDWDLWIRLAIAGIRFLSLDLPLVHYTDVDTSLSQGTNMLYQELRVLEKGYLLRGLKGRKRTACARKTLAAIYHRAALVDRAHHNPTGEMVKLFRSLWAWPFPTFRKERHKSLAINALQLVGLR